MSQSGDLAGQSELELAADVARSYYMADRSKVDIATDLGISRFKVARLLELARAKGIVSIQVHDPRGVDVDLSEALRAELGIRRALVLSSASSERVRVGALAADYLRSSVKPGATVGLAWSRSTQALVKHLHDLPRCTIVQLCGVFAKPMGEEQNVELVRRAAENVGAQVVTFYAPLVVPDAATATTLRRQPGIADALAHCDQLATAVIAVGQWRTGDSTVYDALSERERTVFAKRGAVAESCGILFAADGRPLRDGLQKRTIAVTEAQLRRAGDVVALANEPHRVPAIWALTRRGMVSTLITHRAVAEHILGDRQRAQH
ncbi:MAG TPA: sugar-binding domain-containing protein [Mycobacterium sp.]|jgi:DNA-binding transcriptional regulator LsrR (DeoR family)|nr:sugar-binding domain-containing protein [Mycobacterium sp.]